jgi:rhodanese-related sulfurtransferase
MPLRPGSTLGPYHVTAKIGEGEATKTSVSTHGDRDQLERLLVRARARLTRLEPAEALAATRAGAVIIDTRPEYQRRADGEIPGAIVIERNHLEWRLHPTSEGRIPEARDSSVVWVVVCDEGYSSSLAAATLQLIGLRRSTDIIGGFQAWRKAGLPVVNHGAPSLPRLFERQGRKQATDR